MKLRKIFFGILIITLPFVFLMESVILFFTPSFLKSEYNNPAFPADPYGFTLEERTEYGSESILYITRNYNDDFMRELTFADGTPLYNERELSHMRDVKVLYQTARTVLVCIVVFYVGLGWLVAKNPDSVPEFLKALKLGGMVTLGVMALILAGIIIDFDALFTAFHHLFFTGSTWLFYVDDSLIRLYPEKLWIDGFICVGLATVVMAVAVILITKQTEKKLIPLQK